MTIQTLTKAVAAVCPSSGVSVGRWDDKATWRVDALPEATQGERDAAQSVLDEWAVPTALDEAKAAKNAAVTAKREAVFASGFTPSSGSLAGHTLQVRNETDKINWLTSQASYSAAVMGGHGAVMGATFRTADNETVVASFAEGLQVIVVGMATWGQQIMGRSWVLKDQIDAAPDRAALDAIDINAGWPA